MKQKHQPATLNTFRPVSTTRPPLQRTALHLLLRVKGISAVVTTFGVGELSAINAMAGAFSERIPIVHIVGCPSTRAQESGALLHHSLGNGDFGVFSAMNAKVSCHVAKLERPQEIAQQIDHVIRQCWINSRPVYVALPVDMIHKKVEGLRLRKPIDLQEPPNNAVLEQHIIELIVKQINAAKRPAILVDACAIRHRVLDDILRLAQHSKFSVFVTPMGKGAFDETNPRYRGVYAGKGSDPMVRKEFESSDLILSVGALECDLNTSGFSYQVPTSKVISFHSTHIKVGYAEYLGVGMKGLLHKLSKTIDTEHLPNTHTREATHCLPAIPDDTTGDTCSGITNAWLWPRISKFLREGDIIVTETGTPAFGIWDTGFPSGATLLTQLLWASIGWSIGASQGAALAARDAGEDRRTIVFVGDGSVQLTAQELSTMIRHKLNVTIFCICNGGYTTERVLHRMEASYNDIASWKHKDLLTAFGGGVIQLGGWRRETGRK